MQVVVVDVVMDLLLVLDLLLLEEAVVKVRLMELVPHLIVTEYKALEVVEAEVEIMMYLHSELQTVLVVPALSSLHIPPK